MLLSILEQSKYLLKEWLQVYSLKCTVLHLCTISTLEKWSVLFHIQAKVRVPQLFCEEKVLPQNVTKKKTTFVVSTVGNNWKIKRTKLSFALKSWILSCWCCYLGFGCMFCIVNSTCSPYAEIINIFKVGPFPSPSLQIHTHDASRESSCVFNYSKTACIFLSINYSTLEFINYFLLHPICHILTILLTRSWFSITRARKH